MIYVNLDCDKCKHAYLKDGWKAACAAYPDGIPLDIAAGSNPSEADECNNGMGFEEKEP